MTLGVAMIARSAARYCAERTPIPRFFHVHRGDRHYASGKITVLPFTTICTALNLT